MQEWPPLQEMQFADGLSNLSGFDTDAEIMENSTMHSVVKAIFMYRAVL